MNENEQNNLIERELQAKYESRNKIAEIVCNCIVSVFMEGMNALLEHHRIDVAFKKEVLQNRQESLMQNKDRIRIASQRRAV